MNQSLAGSRRKFRNHGYVICPNLLDTEQVAAIRDAIPAVLDANREELGLSGREDVPDPVRLLDETLCVHHVHKMAPAFLDLAGNPKILRVLSKIIGPQVKFIQSQLFVKPPGFPGNPWHQDEGPIPTRDRSLVAVWIALDDSTKENGCLRVIPGTHRSGYLYPTREHGKTDEFDFTTEAFGFDTRSLEHMELRPGSAVFFHGYLLHGSLRNESTSYRRALTFHYMNGYSQLPWYGGRGDYRDIYPVLGEDPYSWKGYLEQSIPHLRAWPDRGRPKEADDQATYLRRKVHEAIRIWSQDESKAIELLRVALTDATPPPPARPRGPVVPAHASRPGQPRSPSG